MSDNTHVVADYQSETYPEFSGKIQDNYIEGYDPVSFAAPHSSLLRTSTWVGMGLILSCLPAAGILIWGLGVWDTPLGTAGEGNYGLTIAIGVGVGAGLALRLARRDVPSDWTPPAH